MEALQKEPLSSDSEDEDYVPPEVKEPTLSLRKRSGGLELDSDDDHDDLDDDDDHDDLSDEADLVDPEVSPLRPSGVAGPSSSGAGPSGAVAGPSSTWIGAGASGVGAGSSGLNAGAGSSAAGASSAGGSGAGASVAAGSSAGAGGSEKAASSPVADGIIAPGSAAAKAQGQAAAAGADGAPSAEVEEPIAKKPRVEAPAEDKSIDDIWADMNAGVTRAEEPRSAPDAGLAAWLEPSAPPKKQFKVTRLSDLEKAAQLEEPVAKKKGRTGLEGVLDVVRGKSETVIEKTREQWKEFKKDEEVNDELEKYKKDKDRYTDKVAFLQRSDVREWEYEQKGKRRR